MLKLQVGSATLLLLAAILNIPFLAVIAASVHITAMVSEYLITSEINKGNIKMSLVLTSEQKVGLSLSPKTAGGLPATLDGQPIWSVSDPAVLELTVSKDGLSATVAAVGLGSAQVGVVADADLDKDEVRELIGVLDILVVAAEAATLGISAGIPEIK